MKRKFDVYGGFELRRDEGRAAFWDRAEEETELNLRNACGCYIFAIKHGKSLKPWYVGKAERRDFSTECFSGRNRNILCCLHCKNGTLRIFLLPALTEGGKLRGIPGRRGDEYIKHLEEMLIRMAWGVNKELINVQGVAWRRNIVIPGFINSGQGPPRREAQDLKMMLGLSVTGG